MAPFEFGSARPGDERDYWLERAEFHLDLGERTADTRASWAHLQLAGRYLDRVYGGASSALSTAHVLVAEPVAG
jgi:hypothetical protein